ncbi:Eisosome assembly protein [Recurvomyces mirabilis]|uniref:Eisosome assembly protein n=1 Tax=Recurvomyces mirabilis TaxID=574656 RepID=A0AAE0WU69_9PEZI|nr:Eisosome assembly protein [Recurvomyces mirabilis]KAK5160757.1 Eisosome assembly protein [Recurvomyces mirabilis]
MAKQLYKQQNRTPPLELGPAEAASILKGARLSTSSQIKIEQEAQRCVDIEEAARKLVQEHQAAVAKDLERAKYREDFKAQYQQQKAERESGSARQSIPSRGHRLTDKRAGLNDLLDDSDDDEQTARI